MVPCPSGQGAVRKTAQASPTLAGASAAARTWCRRRSPAEGFWKSPVMKQTWQPCVESKSARVPSPVATRRVPAGMVIVSSAHRLDDEPARVLAAVGSGVGAGRRWRSGLPSSARLGAQPPLAYGRARKATFLPMGSREATAPMETEPAEALAPARIRVGGETRWEAGSPVSAATPYGYMRPLTPYGYDGR